MRYRKGRACLRILLCLALLAASPKHACADSGAERDAESGTPGAEASAADMEETTPLEKRVAYERKLLSNPFSIIPHKPNYLLPLTYNNDPNSDPFIAENGDIDNLEVKFQLSLKVALLRNVFTDNGYLFFAYTMQSFWQAYNTENSSPFRETDHEPELMFTIFNDYEILGLKNRIVTVGIVHQSNGQGGDRSRSWNRVYANLVFERDNFYVGLKPWYRLPEGIDDNPDIDKFLGYGELYMLYADGGHTLGVMLRNNLRSHNRWGAQIDWSFPLAGNVKGYVQYFGGYGESLIDYNHSNSRLGAGVMLTNWL